MKKYTPYILIIILFIGFFVPLLKIQAATEFCWNSSGQKLSIYSYGSKTVCEAVKDSNGVSLGNTWGTERPDITVPLEEPVCWTKDGSPYASSAITTEKACLDREAGNVWATTPPAKIKLAPPEITTMDPNYYLLAPLPTLPTGFNTSQTNAFSVYLNTMIKIFIGLCAVLAVVMIVMGGVEYMTSELMHSKEHGKDRITGAVFGLVLALGAYALLNTINPDLLKSDFSTLKDVTVTVELNALEQAAGREGTGVCTPITTSSSPCSPTNLQKAGFENGGQASSICNGESKGTASGASGIDKCSDGNAFSFGLFQINVIAHKNQIPGGVCSGVFGVDPNPPNKQGTSLNDNTLGGCLDRRGKTCFKYACAVTDPVKYEACKNYITNPVNNIAYALDLYQRSENSWGQWGFNASCGFP